MPLYLLMIGVTTVAIVVAMSLLCASVGRLYEPRMTFVQHWFVALKVWVLLAFVSWAWGFTQTQISLPEILNSLFSIGLSVLGAFLTTRLARSGYGIGPKKWLGVGGKVFLTVMPPTFFLLAMYTIIWAPA
jgi:hypothetical protein